jgi:hypothetical protein
MIVMAESKKDAGVQKLFKPSVSGFPAPAAHEDNPAA